MKRPILFFCCLPLLPGWMGHASLIAQGIPAIEGGLAIPDLTRVTIEGELMRVAADGKIDVKTDKGTTQLISAPANMRASGLVTSYSIQGSGKLSMLRRGTPIYVQGISDRKNQFLEPVDEVVVFSPNPSTSWGIAEELEQPDDEKQKSISMAARVTRITEERLFVRYPGRSGKALKKSIPVDKETRVTLNAADIQLAQPGDGVSAIGYVVRGNLVMALNVTVTKKSDDPADSPKANPADEKGEPVAGQAVPAGNVPGMAPKGNAPPMAVGNPGQPKRQKRLRLRAGRTIFINW